MEKSIFRRAQGRLFLKNAKKRYGDGWRYLSEDQRDAIIHREVLDVVLIQDADEYKPAQDLIRSALKQIACANSNNRGDAG